MFRAHSVCTRAIPRIPNRVTELCERWAANTLLLFSRFAFISHRELDFGTDSAPLPPSLDGNFTNAGGARENFATRLISDSKSHNSIAMPRVQRHAVASTCSPSSIALLDSVNRTCAFDASPCNEQRTETLLVPHRFVPFVRSRARRY